MYLFTATTRANFSTQKTGNQYRIFILFPVLVKKVPSIDLYKKVHIFIANSTAKTAKCHGSALLLQEDSLCGTFFLMSEYLTFHSQACNGDWRMMGGKNEKDTIHTGISAFVYRLYH